MMETNDNNNMNELINEAAHTWALALCECSGYDASYAEDFWNKLTASCGVYSEYIYYMINQNFACKYQICGISIVDIMIWGLDHFKAELDTERPQKNNPDLMLLTAFETMLEMEKNPEEYVSRMHSDTGTDYPGKF